MAATLLMLGYLLAGNPPRGGRWLPFPVRVAVAGDREVCQYWCKPQCRGHYATGGSVQTHPIPAFDPELDAALELMAGEMPSTLTPEMIPLMRQMPLDPSLD